MRIMLKCVVLTEAKFVTHSAVRAKMEDILKPRIEMNKHGNENYIIGTFIHSHIALFL